LGKGFRLITGGEQTQTAEQIYNTHIEKMKKIKMSDQAKTEILKAIELISDNDLNGYDWFRINKSRSGRY
jgi:hypothetical protein